MINPGHFTSQNVDLYHKSLLEMTNSLSVKLWEIPLMALIGNFPIARVRDRFNTSYAQNQRRTFKGIEFLGSWMGLKMGYDTDEALLFGGYFYDRALPLSILRISERKGPLMKKRAISVTDRLTRSLEKAELLSSQDWIAATISRMPHLTKDFLTARISNTRNNAFSTASILSQDEIEADNVAIYFNNLSSKIATLK